VTAAGATPLKYFEVWIPAANHDVHFDRSWREKIERFYDARSCIAWITSPERNQHFSSDISDSSRLTSPVRELTPQ
jgi:hypothetical protein